MWEKLTNYSGKLAKQVGALFAFALITVLALAPALPAQALQYSELSQKPVGKVLADVDSHTGIDSLSYELISYNSSAQTWLADIYFTTSGADKNVNFNGNAFASTSVAHKQATLVAGQQNTFTMVENGLGMVITPPKADAPKPYFLNQSTNDFQPDGTGRFKAIAKFNAVSLSGYQIKFKNEDVDVITAGQTVSSKSTLAAGDQGWFDFNYQGSTLASLVFAVPQQASSGPLNITDSSGQILNQYALLAPDTYYGSLTNYTFKATGGSGSYTWMTSVNKDQYNPTNSVVCPNQTTSGIQVVVSCSIPQSNTVTHYINVALSDGSGNTISRVFSFVAKNSGTQGSLNVKILPENRTEFANDGTDSMNVTWNPSGSIDRLRISILGRGDASFSPTGALILVNQGVIKQGSIGVSNLTNGSMKWTIPVLYYNTTDQTALNLAMLRDWEVNVYYVGDGDGNFDYGVSRSFNIGRGTSSLTVDKNQITNGQSATLSWTSTNSAYCDIYDYSKTKPLAPSTNNGAVTLSDGSQHDQPNGTKVVTPTQTTKYVLFCGNVAASDSSHNVTVTVTAPNGGNGTLSISNLENINVSAKQGDGKVDVSLDIKGSGFTGTTGFKVYGPGCSNGCGPIPVSAANDTLIQVRGSAFHVTEGGPYQVSVVKGSTESGKSQTFTVTAGSTGGGNPGNGTLSISNLENINVSAKQGDGKVDVSLDIKGSGFTGTTGFKVYGPGCSNGCGPIPVSAANDTLIQVRGSAFHVTEGGPYQVSVVKGSTESGKSQTFTVTAGSTGGGNPGSGTQSLTITGGTASFGSNTVNFSATGSGNLPDGVLGIPYEVKFNASGGSGSYTWTFATTSPGCGSSTLEDIGLSASGNPNLFVIRNNTTGILHCDAITNPNATASYSVYVQVKDTQGNEFPPSSVGGLGAQQYILRRYPNINNLPGGGTVPVTVSANNQAIVNDGTNVNGGQPITISFPANPNARAFLISDNPFGGLPNSEFNLRLCNADDPTTGSGSGANGLCTWTLPNGSYNGGNTGTVSNPTAAGPNAGVILPIAGNCFKISVVVSDPYSYGTSHRFCVDVITSTSISANPGTISSGQSSTLTWSSEGHVVGCAIDEGFNTVYGRASNNAITGTTSGTFVVSPTQDTTYALTCIGVTSAISHIQYVQVKVTQGGGNPSNTPDFTLDATPASQSVVAGNGSSYAISVNPINGFSSPVNLTISTQTGITASIANPTISNGNTGVTVSTSSTLAAGNYDLTITGTSGSITKTKKVTLVVTSSGGGNPNPDFTLSVTPSTQSLPVGAAGTKTYAVSFTGSNGFTGPVTVTAASSSSSVGVSAVNNDPLNQGSSKSFTVSITSSTPSTTTAAPYAITFTGTSGSITKTATATLSVTGSSNPNDPRIDSFSANPNPLNAAGNTTLTWTTTNVATNACKLEKSVQGATYSVVNPNAPAQQSGLTQSLTASTTFKLTCTNAAGTPSSASTVPVTVGSGGGNNPSPLSITTTGLSAATSGISYSQQLAATGGSGSYTWSISSGSLPQGMTLSASSGYITGTPTAAGTATFTVQVKDSQNSSLTPATKALSITVSAPSTPDFALSFSPTVVSVNQGVSATYYLSATGLNGFSSPISLTSNNPGVSVSVPSSVAVGGSGQITVGTTGLAPGTSSIVIVAQSGSISHTYYLTLTVNGSSGGTGGDFSLSITPSTQTISAACSPAGPSCPNYTVTMTPLNGFTGAVSLSLNSGSAAAALSSTTISAGQSVTINVTQSQSSGSNTLSVTGTANSLTRTATATLNVNAQQANSYTISNLPAGTVSINPGSTSSYYISFGTTNNQTLSTPVALAASESSCIGVSFSPSQVSTPQQVLMTISATGCSSTSTGTAAVTVYGVPSSSIQAMAPGFNVSINGQVATGDFALSIPSTPISAAPGATATISGITSTNSLSGSVTMYIGGLPTSVAVSPQYFNIPAGGGAIGNITLTIPSSGLGAGTYNFTISGTSGSITHSYPLTLTVQNNGGSTQPTFTLSMNPSSYQLSGGQTAYVTIGVNSSNNINGGITPKVTSNLPSGTFVSFSTMNITQGQSATASISTSTTTPPGTYQITFDGDANSGAVHNSQGPLTFTLTVLTSAPHITSFYANDPNGNRVVTTTTDNAGASGAGPNGSYLLGWVSDDTGNICTLVNTNNNSTLVSNGSYSGSANVSVGIGVTKTFRLTCSKNGSTYRDITITGQQ